LVVCRIICYFI